MRFPCVEQFAACPAPCLHGFWHASRRRQRRRRGMFSLSMGYGFWGGKSPNPSPPTRQKPHLLGRVPWRAREQQTPQASKAQRQVHLQAPCSCWLPVSSSTDQFLGCSFAPTAQSYVLLAAVYLIKSIKTLVAPKQQELYVWWMRRARSGMTAFDFWVPKFPGKSRPESTYYSFWVFEQIREYYASDRALSLRHPVLS